MEIKNAIKCIENSTICSHERYKWIQPLIKRVLSNTLSEESIEDFLCLLSNKHKNINKPPLIISQLPKISTTHAIKQINSIDCISNVGLLDFNKPVTLSSGINVFYGKNGAGKSTIFIGICKILGKNKIAHANILYPNKDSLCTFTFQNEKGDVKQLSWESGTENLELQVMIFDSQISNFLVEKDQVNNFEIAHLKMEYFIFLHNLYEKLNKELDSERDKIKREVDSIHSILSINIPYVLTEKYNYDKNKLISLQFTKENIELLAKTQSEIETLEKKDLNSIIKNLTSVNTHIYKILSSIAKRVLKTSEDEEAVETWTLTYNETYFEELDKKINTYNQNKKAFEEKGTKTLDLLIPSDWVTNQKWIDFINKSINFVNSIQNKEYLDKKCLYCQQELKDFNSKNLIKAYSEIHKQNEANLQLKKEEILRFAVNINTSLSILNESIGNLGIIGAELEHIGKKGAHVMSLDMLKLLFENLYDKAEKLKLIQLTDVELQIIQEVLFYYSDLYKNFDGEIKKLQSLALSNDKKHIDLKATRDNLLTIKGGVENKEKIIQYFELQNKLIDIKTKTGDLSVLKQLTSSLKTKFMQESSVIEFKKYLQKEYDAFNFKPPQAWELVTSTISGSSKRSYSLGDIKLAEVFSDGEKKIHALADFFAQLDLN